MKNALGYLLLIVGFKLVVELETGMIDGIFNTLNSGLDNIMSGTTVSTSLIDNQLNQYQRQIEQTIDKMLDVF